MGAARLIPGAATGSHGQSLETGDGLDAARARLVAERPAGLRGRVVTWLLDGRGWRWLRPVNDLVTLSAAVLLAVGGPHAVLGVSGDHAALLALPPLVMLQLWLRGLYRRRLRMLILDGVGPLVRAVSAGVVLVAVLDLVLYGRAVIEPLWLRAWLLALLLLGGGRIAIALSQRYARQRRLIQKPVLIVGAGLIGAKVARRLDTHPEYGLTPVGFLDDDPPINHEIGALPAPVLAPIDALEEVVERTGVRQLIVAFTSAADRRVIELVRQCEELGVEVIIVPRLFESLNQRMGYEVVGGLPVVALRPVDPRGWQFAVKHAFDRVLALLLLVCFSPLMAVIALAVRRSSPGPILFRQRRVGRDRREFDLLKFRSMRIEPAGSRFTPEAGAAPGGVEGTDRRTRIGRLLRRTSLDELPQLINVVRGEMSIVGPRPERPEFVNLFRHDIARYEDRHRVRSGITGWSQVHGLRGQTSLADRIEWDNYYIAHWSLGLDLKIIALTPLALVRSSRDLPEGT